jgi:hypothetical protein
MVNWLDPMACAIYLVLSCLPHVGNDDTFSRAEAVVFVTHSQFVVKPD